MVLAVNAWMQHPVGFTVSPTGAPVDVDAWAVFANPAWAPMAAHSTLSCYQAVGFAAAAHYAWTLWRQPGDRYARLGLTIALAVATVAAVAMPLTGDLLAKRAHHLQPAKLAAAEAHFETRRHAPLTIGGWPDVERRETRYGLEIPGALSFLADSRFDTEVVGLDRFPRDEWPNVPVTHLAFQIMVGSAMAMLGAALWYWLAWWRARRRRTPLPRPLLVALVLCGPLGFLALEAGWVVTEVGRQPWVIYGVMRTADAATAVRGVWASLALFTTVYTGLLVLLVFFVRRLRRSEVAA
jgi:cytochrome bd ubiquinol oxidase subunit I